VNDCIFCKIIGGEIPAKPVYECEDFIIINDVNPIAPKHYLLLPRNHYATLAEMNGTDAEILGRALKTVSGLQKELGLENGYRLVINQGADAGQSVLHLHIHILAGTEMSFTVD
jgi:histidine triad (HIT) family protein